MLKPRVYWTAMTNIDATIKVNTCAIIDNSLKLLVGFVTIRFTK